MAEKEIQIKANSDTQCNTWKAHVFRQTGNETPSYDALAEMEKHGTPMPPRHKSPKKVTTS